MSRITNGLAACGVAAIVGLSVATLAPTAESVPAPAPTPTTARHAVTVPTELPSHADAERYYRTHLGPSAAWRHAGKAERKTAMAAYVYEFGGIEDNGCMADVRHAYQGSIADDQWRQPSLPAVSAGADNAILFAEYTDGICHD